MLFRSKRLAKKYRSLIDDISPLIDQLSQTPTIGIPVGNDCYKIRLSLSSKGKGKSGGARIITYVLFLKNVIFLMDIYDKSEQENITKQELENIINKIRSTY